MIQFGTKNGLNWWRLKTDKKIKRIEQLIERLESGRDVPRKDLKVVLADEEMQKLDDEWEIEKQSRTDKPKEIVEYEKRLGITVRKFGLYENLLPKIEQDKSTTLHNNCQDYCYELIEYLREHIDIILNWLCGLTVI